MPNRLRAARFDAVSLAVALLLVASPALAGPIIVGSLVFQNTIPAGPAGPGTNAFWLYWSPTLLPLSDVSLTVTGTNAQGQSVGGTWATTGAFDPNLALGGQAFPTNATITSATVTGSAANGQVDWASQRYQIAAQGVAATLTNASGLVPFPFGPDGTGDATPVTVTPTPRHYYLAEGATVWTFDTQIAMANRGSADAPVTVTFLLEGGGTVQTTLTVAAGARATLRAADVPGLLFKSFSTVVTSDEGVPLSVERTMTWDGGHGAHAGLAAEALSPVWYFAEGVQSWMDTYVLVANPGDVTADVTVTFFLNVGEPVVRLLTVGSRSRATVWTGSIPELTWRSFGIMLTSTQPVVSERAVYFGTAERWDGGTLAMGVTAPSSEWYFGEGVLGTIFDEYLLLSNPSATPTTVTVDYLPATGSMVTRTYPVAAQARQTILVTAEPLGIPGPNGLGMRVKSPVPIVAERAMYLINGAANWYEGHASPGSTTLGTVWEVADCVVGTFGVADSAETFLTLSNPGQTASDVRVTYSREDNKAPVVKTHTVPAEGRLTIWVNGTAPELTNERFGASIEVVSGPPIVVERSVYWSSRGLWWAAATNTLGTKLQ